MSWSNLGPGSRSVFVAALKGQIAASLRIGDLSKEGKKPDPLVGCLAIVFALVDVPAVVAAAVVSAVVAVAAVLLAAVVQAAVTAAQTMEPGRAVRYCAAPAVDSAIAVRWDHFALARLPASCHPLQGQW